MKGEKVRIGLVGNPNVGKSTVFNALTGLKQHTGNWTGKTVTHAVGYFECKGNRYELVDLPGTYSLIAHSAEEEVTRDFVLKESYDKIMVVCDAVCLERNLNLVLQIKQVTNQIIVCVNLLDEARKKKITIDLEQLEKELGVPVVGMSARSGDGIQELQERLALSKLEPESKEAVGKAEEMITEEKEKQILKEAEQIASRVVHFQNKNYDEKQRKWDRLLTNKITGIPIMLLGLGIILWITMIGANYPSQLLSNFLFNIGNQLELCLQHCMVPPIFIDLLINGIYKVVAWVVSVMLPPMAIFFPLFTLLEDLGVLPRIAFNMDGAFKKCSACGKQALTMCMGIGCNACGVTGCRIIDSPRERLLAILTNSFVPCNGKFPTLIAIITIFFAQKVEGVWGSLKGTLILLALIALGILMTFLVSKGLSKTVLKGKPSSFILELPPYRKPQIGKVIIRSILDRTLFVLGRAVLVAAPAGLVLWCLVHIEINQIPIILYVTKFLNPLAMLIGLDGVILTGFILGFPANEIVMPIILMVYTSAGQLVEMDQLTKVGAILTANGWTTITALCMLCFMLFHWPCSTTCLTIYKETKSVKWTILGMLIPTCVGIFVCAVVHMVGYFIGIA